MSYDLQDYSIVNLAFPEEFRPAGGVQDNIYLQGQEDGVVYSLVWNPTKIKAMLCDIVRKQNGDRIPQMSPGKSVSLSEDERGAEHRRIICLARFARAEERTSAVNCLAKRRGEHMINRKLMRSTGNRGSVT